MRTFEADELLDKVRDELEDLKGVLVETHALPNCDVSRRSPCPSPGGRSSLAHRIALTTVRLRSVQNKARRRKRTAFLRMSPAPNRFPPLIFEVLLEDHDAARRQGERSGR
ncbi:hypothetical protein [Streptomyces sp. enrichment culture]|uniref:hypothetical protein n=1 Tax=Streptomyces sp. enrichment culture TaxID=1795815 RepID=UPI003F571603